MADVTLPQQNDDKKVISLNDNDIRAGPQLFTIFGGNKDLLRKTGFHNLEQKEEYFSTKNLEI